uniref:Alpha/beta hydrolase family protein n=1 Tax=Siphoviridae sp. ctL7J9 TaxID=2827845 RepID=A0A8S5T5P7_9CAUD|nr:MAG TPA: alpha/beta hydrolase family protein [Siphoviridae sp. ctL7J9]
MIRGGQRCKQVQCVCSARFGHGAGGLAAHKYLQLYPKGQSLRP